MTNAQGRRELQEYDRRRDAKKDTSQRSIPEMASKEMNLKVMPNQSTISRLCKIETKFKDNKASFNPSKKAEYRSMYSIYTF